MYHPYEHNNKNDIRLLSIKFDYYRRIYLK